MKTFAPGKLVLTGAYAVLKGAPSVAIAVSRGAYADSDRAALIPTPEVRAALGDVPVPHADASEMFVGARKLGLGASAAILVASLAAHQAKSDADLADPLFRDDLFARARKAHADAQKGGSGVDIATSIHGGTIQYTVDQPIRRVAVPKGLEVHVFACATSARTSELRAEIQRLAAAQPTVHDALMADLVAIANDGARAARDNDALHFVDALRRTARTLAKLGEAANIPIVPNRFDELETIALAEDASFSVSGAGGGDVAVYIGPGAPSSAFHERAHALGLFPLPLTLDNKGVKDRSRIAPQWDARESGPSIMNTQNRTSSLPGFYKVTIDERRSLVSDATGVAPDTIATALENGGLSAETADKFVENVLGTYGLPYGVTLNVRVNGQDHVVPMVVEEPSVVAAASNAAKMVRAGGGFSVEIGSRS